MVIAVDFDGILTREDKYPNIGALNVKMILLLKRLRENGIQLILWTCRTDDDLTEAVETCREIGLEFDAINTNVPEVVAKGWGKGPKVYADIYLDDKAVNNPMDLIRSVFKSGTEKILEAFIPEET